MDQPYTQTPPPVQPQPSTPKPLRRSRTDRVIAGVCGGLAEYFQIDATLVRVIFVAFVLSGGFGLLLYVILWLVIPEAGAAPGTIEAQMKMAGQEMKSTVSHVANEIRADNRPDGRLIVGGVLVFIGAVSLLNMYLPWHWIKWETLWPAIIILAGVAIIFKRR